MANTVNTMMDDEILAKLVDGTIEELEDDMITTLRTRALCNIIDEDGVRHLKKLYLPNVTSISGSYVLNGSIGYSSSNPNLHKIHNLDGSIFPKLQDGAADVFRSLSVKRVNLPEWTGGSSVSTSKGNRFRGMTSLETLVLGKCCILNTFECEGDTALRSVCLGDCGSDYGGQRRMENSTFYNCTNLNTLVIYGTKLFEMSTTGALANNTPFASNGTGGTIYVPQSMIDTYTSATNWSTIIGYTNNQILPIEGSPYEYFYCDGTPIGLGNTGGMIAYYDVGNADDWDSETKTIASHVENDFVAWGNSSMSERLSGSVIPTIYYDGYSSNRGDIQIYFGKPLNEISDTVTLEYLYAANYSNFSFALTAGIKTGVESSVGQTWVYGYTGGINTNNRTFHLITVELNSSGVNRAYIDGEVVKQNASLNKCMEVTAIGIGSQNGYLGHVSVWDRALTEDEIAEHYQYYADNFHVGETAFDSSGNFIAT